MGGPDGFVEVWVRDGVNRVTKGKMEAAGYCICTAGEHGIAAMLSVGVLFQVFNRSLTQMRAVRAKRQQLRNDYIISWETGCFPCFTVNPR